MNKKVEELVEWLAKGLRYEERKGSIPWESLDEGAKAYWLHLAKIILSHPDLALIKCIGCKPRKEGWHNVIPLAEALKEIEE